MGVGGVASVPVGVSVGVVVGVGVVIGVPVGVSVTVVVGVAVGVVVGVSVGMGVGVFAGVTVGAGMIGSGSSVGGSVGSGVGVDVFSGAPSNVCADITAPPSNVPGGGGLIHKANPPTRAVSSAPAATAHGQRAGCGGAGILGRAGSGCG